MMMRRLFAITAILLALLCAAQAQWTNPGGGPLIVASGSAASINNALLQANAAGGGTVFVPTSVSAETSVVMQSNTALWCAKGVTIQAKNSLNADVITSPNAESKFGSNSSTGGIDNATIQSCIIDGNKSNQSGSGLTCGTTGQYSGADCVNGVAIYGTRISLIDVEVNNVLGHQIHSQGNTAGITSSYEWELRNVKTFNSGRHGWWDAGPSDAHASHLTIKSSSQEADNTYDGIFMDTTGSPGGLWIEYLNIWHATADTNRMRYGLNSAGARCINCEITGMRTQVNMAAAITSIVAGHITGGTFNTGTCLVNVSTAGNSIVNTDFVATEGQGYYGVCIGPSGSVANNNLVNNFYNGFTTDGPFDFVNDGGNTIIGRGVTVAGSGATSFGGTISSSSTVQYDQSGGTAFSYHQSPSNGIVQTNTGNAAGGGTITPSVNRAAYLSFVKIHGVGGGGAGGAGIACGSGASCSGGGGGGGAGSFDTGWISWASLGNPSSCSMSIAAPGAGGVVGGTTSGGGGGAASITCGSTTFTANGGGGGAVAQSGGSSGGGGGGSSNNVGGSTTSATAGIAGAPGGGAGGSGASGTAGSSFQGGGGGGSTSGASTSCTFNGGFSQGAGGGQPGCGCNAGATTSGTTASGGGNYLGRVLGVAGGGSTANGLSLDGFFGTGGAAANSTTTTSSPGAPGSGGTPGGGGAGGSDTCNAGTGTVANGANGGPAQIQIMQQ